jgi:hypothetical protein
MVWMISYPGITRSLVADADTTDWNDLEKVLCHSKADLFSSDVFPPGLVLSLLRGFSAYGVSKYRLEVDDYDCESLSAFNTTNEKSFT